MQTYDVLDGYGNPIETRQYEDWNNNSTEDPGEKSWVYDTQDSDSDGLVDAREIAWGTDPYNPDSDYDGLTDGNEVDLLGGPVAGYDPTLWDTNGDGYSDYDHLYADYRVHYPTVGNGQSYFDWDGDGAKNPADSHPLNSSYQGDWNNNGVEDSAETFMDMDGDGHEDVNDSHPQDPSLWDDWNNNGVSDEVENSPTYDGDGDGYPNVSDSHPADPALWNDRNNNGINDESEGTSDTDGDGYIDANDSHPGDPALWNDRNYNGYNDEIESINSDEDAWPDFQDSHPNDSTLWDDWDYDGLSYEAEYLVGTNPAMADTDGDGLWDGDEIAHNTNPHLLDTDNDGLTDYDELVVYAAVQIGGKTLDPNDPNSLSPIYLDSLMVDTTDTDGDGIPDRVEDHYPGMDKTNSADAGGDLDADFVSNLQEYLNGTLFDGGLEVYDHDRDGMTNVQEDYWSAQYPGLLNKYWFNDAVEDPDQDGLLNFEELRLGLNPNNASTYSGTSDLAWVNGQQGTVWIFPLAPNDTDGDGMTDLWEHRYFLDVRNPADALEDPDGDQMSNLNEFGVWKNPRIHDAHSQAVIPVPGDLSGGISSNLPFIPSLPASLPSGSTTAYKLIETLANGGGNFDPEPQCEVCSEERKLSESWPLQSSFSPRGRVSIAVNDNVCFLVEEGLGPYYPCQHGTKDMFYKDVEFYTAYDHCPHGESNYDPKQGRVKMRLRVTDPLPPGETIIKKVQCTYKLAFGWPQQKYVSYLEISEGETTSPEIELVVNDGGEAEIKLIEAAEPHSQSLSASDGGGARYRKVGLNGFPIADSKPQVQNENGEEEEETYVDAFLSQLRHSVTDVYVTEPASLVPLTVRRDVTPSSWNGRSGLRPDERPDLPFGPCWSSNICSYIRFDDLNKAEVVDEMGAQQTFFLYGSDNKGYGGVWVHDRQEYRDQKMRSNKLVTTGPGASFVTDPASGVAFAFRVYSEIKFHKKFGTTCTYQMVAPVDLHQVVPGDRIERSGGLKTSCFARLTEVEDRWGNKLLYEYPDSSSLVPSVIRDPSRPGHEIAIQQTGGRVTKIRQPNGGVVEYEYEHLGIPGFPYQMLKRVIRGNSVVGYEYITRNETENTPQQTVHHHNELARIRDERGNDYLFDYQLNSSVSYWDGEAIKASYGLPMQLTKVSSPMGGELSVQTTRTVSPASEVWIQNTHPVDTNDNGVIDMAEIYTKAAAPPFTTTFTWAQNAAVERVFSYKFTDAEILIPSGHPDATDSPETVTYGFKTMILSGPCQTAAELPAAPEEVYRFDPGHGMALKSVTDRNGNDTTFSYAAGDDHDDPVGETNALGDTKTLNYHAQTRILAGMTDVRSVTTTYAIDALGRRTAEVIQDGSTGPALIGGSRKTWTFAHAQFPGFATLETLDTPSARGPSDPALAQCPVVTTSWSTETDTGKAGWWRYDYRDQNHQWSNVQNPDHF